LYLLETSGKIHDKFFFNETKSKRERQKTSAISKVANYLKKAFIALLIFFYSKEN